MWLPLLCFHLLHILLMFAWEWNGDCTTPRSPDNAKSCVDEVNCPVGSTLLWFKEYSIFCNSAAVEKGISLCVQMLVPNSGSDSYQMIDPVALLRLHSNMGHHVHFKSTVLSGKWEHTSCSKLNDFFLMKGISLHPTLTQSTTHAASFFMCLRGSNSDKVQGAASLLCVEDCTQQHWEK